MKSEYTDEQFYSDLNLASKLIGQVGYLLHRIKIRRDKVGYRGQSAIIGYERLEDSIGEMKLVSQNEKHDY